MEVPEPAPRGASVLHCPLLSAGPQGHAAQALPQPAVLLNEGTRRVDEWMRALLTLTHPTHRPEEMFWSVKAEEPHWTSRPLWGRLGASRLEIESLLGSSMPHGVLVRVWYRDTDWAWNEGHSRVIITTVPLPPACLSSPTCQWYRARGPSSTLPSPESRLPLWPQVEQSIFGPHGCLWCPRLWDRLDRV